MPENQQLVVDEEFLSHPNIQVAKDVLCSQVKDEAVLLHISAGIYYRLTETSLLVWKALQNRQPLTAVVEQITNDYEVERSLVIDDIQALLSKFFDYGIINRESFS